MGRLIKRKAAIDLNQFVTDDYQNRRGDYPAAGKPVSIEAYENTLDFSFKNTSEQMGRKWVERFAKQHDLPIESIDSWQDGDYQDDWIVVSLAVKMAE
jgi:hypothetical protein